LGKDQYAYAGKILRINLSNGDSIVEPTIKYAGRFFGGRAISRWILWKETRPSQSAFDPDSPIIVSTGVLCGTLAPGACRYNIDSKNVFSGGVGSSNAGGHFALELKFAGYDHIIVQGRCNQPSYLRINDGDIELRSAKHMWGMNTWDTEDFIREELADEDVQVACIGPAGENLVKAACVISNKARAAGRCGLGAIFGSKNLKAIAVRGTGTIEVARPDEFIRRVEVVNQKLRQSKILRDRTRFGTTVGFESMNLVSGNPVRNFQDGFWDVDKVNRTKDLIPRFSVADIACLGCPMSCRHYLRVPTGVFCGTEGEGLESNSLRNFGPKLDIDDPRAIIKAHVLCNQLGLDVDNTAGVIAWAFECYEKGILRSEDLDGLTLDWGNYEAVMELIHKLATRDGVGNLMAEGSKTASKKLGRGSERYAITIKGQELYEPLRCLGIGWALGVIVSATAGGHLRGAPLCERLQMGPKEATKAYGVSTACNRVTYKGKAKLVVYTENFKAAVDNLGVCYLLTQWTGPEHIDLEDLALLASAAIGRDFDRGVLGKMGEITTNLEKAFNVREGILKKEDFPPQRFYEPMPSGPARGEHVDPDMFAETLEEYYVCRGWNRVTGLQSRRQLTELGLSDVAEELGRASLLAPENPNTNCARRVHG